MSLDHKNYGCEVTTENRINKQTFHSFEPIVSRSGEEWAGQLGQRRRSEQNREPRGDKKWANGGWDARGRTLTHPSTEEYLSQTFSQELGGLTHY